MPMFVEEVKYTKVKDVVDGFTYDGADISLVPTFYEANPKSIQLVVGAAWVQRCACSFSKKGLGILIADLQAVHEAMGD